MSVREEVDILHKIPLFAGVKKDHLNTLAFATEHVEFAPGELIIEEGGAPEAAYLILSGNAEVVFGELSNPHTTNEIGEQSFIGETAILNNIPYRTTVRAKTDVLTLQISQQLFFRSITEFPDMALAIMRVLAHRLDDTLLDLVDLKNQLQPEEIPAVETT
jgi:CRP-like cAMP-binding protein